MQNHQQQKRTPLQTQPTPSHEADDKTPALVGDPRLFSPANILRLQRSIGNQAVLRLSRGGQAPQVQPSRLHTPHLQREEEKEGPAPLGNVYEYKFDIEKGDRYAFSVAVSISKADTSPLKAETESGLTGQIGESKATVGLSRNPKGEYAAAHALALALAKSSYEMEPIPGVIFKYEMKTLEAKLDLMDISKLDVDMLKVAAALDVHLTSAIVEAALSDDILAKTFGELIRSGTTIKFTFKGEVKIHPDDAARLVEAFKASQQIAKNAEAAAKLVRQQRTLLQKNQAIWRQLATTTDRVEKARLNRLFARNKAALNKIGRALGKNIEQTKNLRGVYNAAAKGLTSRAGRILGVKAAQVAARVLTKAIPVVGWLLLAYDVGSLLYEVYNASQSDFEEGAKGGGSSPLGSDSSGASGGGDFDSAEGTNGDMTDDGTTDGGLYETDNAAGSTSGGTSDTDGSLPSVTDLGEDMSGVTTGAGGALPSVTDLGDDVSGGTTGTSGSLASVSEADEDVTDGGMSAGVKMPKDGKRDKTDVTEIIAGIRHYKGIIDASDQTSYLSLPAECKKGDTFDRWFFWYGSDQLHATYTKVTILKRKGNTITIKLAPSSVYLEDGTFVPNGFEGDAAMTRVIQQPEN